MQVKETLTAEQVLDKFNLDIVELLAKNNMEEIKCEYLLDEGESQLAEAHVLDIASGSWGWRMYEPLSDFFGIEFDRELAENDGEYQIYIHEHIDSFIPNVELELNKHFKDKLPGDFYFGYHEGDSSFCLFYQERVFEIA